MNQHGSNLLQPSSESPSATPQSRPCNGFSLVELLVVIGIVTLLLGGLLPVINRARELSVRTQCASNLRQVGLTELRYANENRGWIFLRDIHHGGLANNLTRQNNGYFSINLSQYISPQIFYCPHFYRTQSSKVFWSDADRTTYAKDHMMGYAFYGAGWISGAPQATQTDVGVVRQCTNNKAHKITHLKPSTVRASEMYSPRLTVWNGPSGWWHMDRSGIRPAGGNVLFGDGSVSWSTTLVTWPDCIYTMAPGYPTWQP